MFDRTLVDIALFYTCIYDRIYASVSVSAMKGAARMLETRMDYAGRRYADSDTSCISRYVESFILHGISPLLTDI